MSKSTRMTPEQLRLMGLEEYAPGKYRPKSKPIILNDDDDLTRAGQEAKRLWMGADMFDGNKTARYELDEQGIIPSGTKGRFEWGKDGKSKFVPDKDGQWEIVNRPNDTPPLYQTAGVDPAYDEPSHSVVVVGKKLPNGDIEYDLGEHSINDVLKEAKRLYGDYYQDAIEKGQILVKTKDIVYNTYISLVVKGEPTPQQRHRHHQVKGSDFVTTYDPSSKAKKEFLKQCFPYRPDKPYEQPLRVDMVFYFSRPKSHYRSGKNAHLLKDNAPEYHITRPDSDNLAKLVKDALNKTFWKDDSLVCDLNIKKRYGNDNPRTEITITLI